ncbi:MAG: Ig-like domain-containing protein [bacterium]|nr:Ig-like domain-containing protein [bacterium]
MNAKYNHKLIGLVLLMFMAATAYAGGGIEWTNINDGLPNDIQIANMVIDPGSSSTIYAATGLGEVYKTVDSGSNWTNISNGLDILSASQYKERYRAYTALTVDSTNIYLGCSGRIFKGTKDGSSWTDITGTMTLSSWSALSIVAQSDAIYVGNSKDGVYKSIDNGASWSKIYSNSNCRAVIAGTTTGNLYALTYSPGLLVTTDGGQSWGSVSSQYFYDMLVYPDAMYATTWNGIVRSTNNGSTWGTITTGLPQTQNQRIVCFAGNPVGSSTLYAWIETYSPNSRALYKTTDGGNSWSVTSLSPSANAARMLVTGDAVYVAGKGIHKSADNGTSWIIINNGLPHHVDVSTIAVDPKATGTVYMASWRGIFKSTDAGNSWSEKNTGLLVTYAPHARIYALTIDPNNSNIIYAGGTQMLYKSIDGGDSWGSITAGLMQGANTNISSIAIDPNNSQTVYASGDWEKIYKSIDGGTSWSQIAIPQTSFTRLLIAPEDSSILYGVPSYGSKIYRSNNQGGSWTTIQAGSNLHINGITLGTTSQTIYVSTSDFNYYQYTLARILKTIDSGSTWTQISDKEVNSLIVNPDITGILYAFGNDGVIKSIDDGKSWGKANSGLPIINTGRLLSAIGGSVGNTASFVMDPAMHDRFYINYPPYGIYRGTDTNAAPAPPSIQIPANGAKISDQTPLIIGSSSHGSVVLVYNEASTLLGTATTNSIGLFSLSCNSLNTGMHTLHAISVDRFGTSSQAYLSLTIVQGVAPTIDNPVSGATNQATITITGTAEDNAAVAIYNGLIPIATTTSTNGFYSYTAKLSDGLYSLYVQSTNNDGVVAASNIVDLLIDTVAPMPPVITKPAYGSKMPDDILTITGLTIASSTVFIYINSIEIGSVTSNGNGEISFTTPILDDGLNEITARVKDSVGNISPSSYPVKVTIGIPPIIISPVSGKTSKSTDIVISGKCRANASVGVYLDSVNMGTATVTNCTFSYTLTNLAAGTHTVTVNAVKGAKSGFSNIVTLMIQPDLPIDPVGVNISSPRGTEHPMSMDEDNNVSVSLQSTITVTVPVIGTPTAVYIKYSGTTAAMSDNDHDGIYEYSFKPYLLRGNVPLTIVIEYPSGQSYEVNIGSLLIDPDGHVYNTVTLEKVVDAVVTCYWFSTATTTWEIWPAWDYPFNNVPQINPQTTTTGNDCYYSFMVPAGKYYVHAVCPGYKTYQSGVLEVIDDPVHHDIYMEPLPVLTSLKVVPQSIVLGPGGTYSLTAVGYDQYKRSMGDIECSWSSNIGRVTPTNGKSITFTAPSTVTTGIITAASGTVQGTASIIVYQSVTIKLSPQTIYAQQNEVFTLNIDIADVVDLLGAKIVLSFDKTKVRAGTVTAGNFFSQNDPSFQLFSTVKNPEGIVEINGARLASSGVTGSGTLYSVTFTTMFANCSGTISISEAGLKDINLSIILAGDKYPAVIRGRLLGDFGRLSSQPLAPPEEIADNKIDYCDLLLFSKYWNDNNLKGDIASTRTTGFIPDFTYEPDGKINFEDLAYFATMWRWDHNKGTQAPRLASKDTAATTAIVKLKTMKMDENKVCVDVVVENATDLLAAHLILGFDANFELATITSQAFSFPSFPNEAQIGQVSINLADLNGKLTAGGSIARLIFHPKFTISNAPLAISIVSADLRNTQAKKIPSCIMPISTPASDLTKAYCYPNPYISSEHTQGITFAELTAEARIRIFDIAGEMVYDSGMVNTNGGKFNWTAVNQSNTTPVASGIYLYLITNNHEQRKTGKLGIIR